MYVQTKKVVIIYIVTLITFASVASNLYRETQSTIPQISVISSEELSYKISFAQSIFNAISLDADGSEELAMYGASIYQIGQTSENQLTNIVNSSSTIVIIGDAFNDYLNQLIVENDERQFVLIENSLTFDYSNVYQLNIDYQTIYSAINRASAHQKSVVVIANSYSKLAEEMYYQSEIATNGNIKLEIVEDTNDVAALKSALDQDFKNGFTQVYSLNPYNNATIIEVINNHNQDIKTAIITQQASEASESENSELETKVIDDNDVVDSSAYASLRYLTLSQTDYLSEPDTEYLTKYLYNASDQTKKVIDSTLNEQIKQGSELISITNNN